MNISEKIYVKIINVFIVLISITLIFRKPCTWFIILYSAFCLLNYKKLEFNKKALFISLFIALPLIVELVLFWNNDSFVLGLKSLEKSTALIVFPLFVIGNYKRISFIKIANFYRIFTTLIVFVFYIFYIKTDVMYLTKYSKGIDIWELGYSFANFVGMHGPALNMHMAFVAICNFYFIFYKIKDNNIIVFISNFLLFITSIFLVIYINSKLALFNALIGILMIIFFEIRKKINTLKLVGLCGLLLIMFFGIINIYVKENPYMIKKYKEVTFAHMDKIGKLDELKDPEGQVYNSFVTRLSIWKSTIELSFKNLPFGVGASDGKPQLFKYYKQTNQFFLERHKLPVHNQFLDAFLKFGILGLLSITLYFLNMFYLGIKTKNVIICSFSFLFFASNLTDDFLIRFDGIVFSAFWITIFTTFYLKTIDIDTR